MKFYLFTFLLTSASFANAQQSRGHGTSMYSNRHHLRLSTTWHATYCYSSLLGAPNVWCHIKSAAYAQVRIYAALCPHNSFPNCPPH